MNTLSFIKSEEKINIVIVGDHIKNKVGQKTDEETPGEAVLVCGETSPDKSVC